MQGGTKALLAALCVALGLTACVPSRTIVNQQTENTTIVQTSTAPAPTFTPPAPRTAAGLPPGAKVAKGYREGRCPYIASSPDQNPKVNVADLNGSHVYRTAVSTASPANCSFYFYAPPYQAQVDITVRVFSTARAAHDAMVLTARTGTQQQGHPGIRSGVDAILYRTKFFAPDGARDWACAFAAGNNLVIVRTDRTDTSLNALLIAQAIAGKF